MKLSDHLRNMGLEKKQADVYLACLELGSASAYRIANITSLPRSTCYETLDGLIEMGLVHSFRKKRVRVFSAEDPKVIIQKNKERIADFEEALPQFNALFASIKDQPTVRFYQGKSGMKIIFQEMLGEAKEILGFSSADDLFENLGDYWPSFVEKRIKKKIPVRNILKDSKKARERKALGAKQLRTVRLLPANFSFGGIIAVWENKIAMFSFKKEMVALVIESPILAQTQKAMFEVVWNSLED